MAAKDLQVSAISASQIYMIFGSIRLRAWLAAILGFCVLPEAHAAFNGFMPLAYSGQVAYLYGYAENSGTQSEATRLSVGLNATGYVWRPWFATTSMALNLGLTNSETTTSSSDGTSSTGTFSLGIFPRSRFPFTIRYSRSDSRSQRFQNISQVSGDTSFTVTRLDLRQSYSPRSSNQLYNGWYNSTKFEGDSFNSESEGYGMDYQLRATHQVIAVTAAHSSTTTDSSSSKPTVATVALSHVYTPGPDLGVTSLGSYVDVDPGDDSSTTSLDTQAFSSFFWRPEHRAISVTGGVRLSENKSKGTVDTVARSLSTSLGVGYKITRSLNMSASASVGTADSEAAQSLSTTQTLGLTYSGGRRQFGGYAHTWNWSGNGANSTNRTEVGGEATTTDKQSFGTSVSQSLGKSWSLSRASSLAGTLSQSVSGTKNSEVDEIRSTVSHSVSLGRNSRGARGSSYLNARLSDSRSFGETDSVFNIFGLTYSADISFNRLSSMSGNASFSASQNETEDDLGVKNTDGTRNLVGGLSYNHNRPFGVYNLGFITSLQGSKQIDSPVPSSAWRSESTFRYRLGLLATSLSLRFVESAGGAVAKSLSFQATRSF